MEKRNKAKIVKDIVLEAKTEGELLIYLLDELKGKNRNNIKSLLTNKQVIVNGKVVTRYNHKLKPTDQIKIDMRRSNSPTMLTARGFSIVFEDEHLIVIDKHAGILSIANENEKKYTAYSFLSTHVKYQNPSNKIFVVHRLDRETSGLMVFAKSIQVQKLLQDNWRDMITERTYIAITEGVMKDDSGVIQSYLHESKALIVHSSNNPNAGKLAITNYKVLKRSNEHTMLEVRLDTGRKNQIRVHMQELGFSLIADKKYGATTNPIGRLGLHSRVLGFHHPITKEPMRFQTAIPRKFTRLF